jgi:hypothetical protein
MNFNTVTEAQVAGFIGQLEMSNRRNLTEDVRAIMQLFDDKGKRKEMTVRALYCNVIIKQLFLLFSNPESNKYQLQIDYFGAIMLRESAERVFSKYGEDTTQLTPDSIPNEVNAVFNEYNLV